MKHIIFSVCSLFTITLLAQVKNIKYQALEFELKAEESFANQEFGDALQSYLEYEKLVDSMSTDMNLKIGVSCLEVYHYSEALDYLSKCEKDTALLNFSFHYYYAKSLQLNNRVEEAKKHYLIYLIAIEDDDDFRQFVEEIKLEIIRCDNAIAMIANPVKVHIQLFSLMINGPFDDYSPLLSPNEKQIYFTSDRPFITDGHELKLDDTNYENIYVSNKVDGEWSNPQKVLELDSRHHDACVALSHNGHQMIVYSYKQTDMFHKASGHLYLSNKIKNVWSKPELLPLSMSSKSREVSACFSIDDKELFFTSNHASGFGGTDIFRTKLQDDGTWSDPVNLGETVNTTMDEDAPFIHPDGKTLYFSSTGHRSMGGFDIFKSTILEGDVYAEPENLGYPINTTTDDISFSVSADGKKIYFADNRVEGQGDMDIYTAEYYEENQDLYVLKGNVLSDQGQLLLGVVINVHESGRKAILSVYSSNNENGEFVIKLNEGKDYVLKIEKEGFMPFSEVINTKNLEGFHEYRKNLTLVAK